MLTVARASGAAPGPRGVPGADVLALHGVLGASDSAEGEDTSNPGRFAGDGSGDGVSAGDGFHGEEVSEFDGVGSVKDQPILAQTSTCDHEDGGPDSVGAA